jgi:hypothetical protein
MANRKTVWQNIFNSGCSVSKHGIKNWVLNNCTTLKISIHEFLYQNYKLVKDNLYSYGFQTRLLKPFIQSSCQRDAVKVAADELGMLPQCREYFKSYGYKWYHLIPDIVLKKPSVLFTKNFWSTTLFTKTYHPRVDFEKTGHAAAEGT